MFQKFQTLAPGEQSYYSKKFKKLMDSNYQLTPIQQPKFSTNHNFRGWPKGALNKLKSHKSTTSTKRDQSGFEYQLPKRKRGRPAKKEANIKKKKIVIKKKVESEEEEEDSSLNFHYFFQIFSSMRPMWESIRNFSTLQRADIVCCTDMTRMESSGS